MLSVTATAAEFADGTVAWLLETDGGQNSEHAMAWSMSPKTSEEDGEETELQSETETGGQEETGSGEEEGEQGEQEEEEYTFSITDLTNQISPVLSPNSIYQATLSFTESTDCDIDYAAEEDYLSVELGSQEWQAFAAGEQQEETVYLFGDSVLTWMTHPNEMHNAAAEYMNSLINSTGDDRYNILATCNVTITGLDGQTLYEYSRTEWNLSAFTDTYNLEGKDFTLSGSYALTVDLYEEEIDPDPVIPENPDPGHSGSGGMGGNGTGGGNGDGDGPGTGDGTDPGNENGTGGEGSDPNGTEDGNPDGTTPGGNTGTTQTNVPQVPVSGDVTNPVSVVIPAVTAAVSPAVEEPQEETSETEPPAEAAPDSGGGGDPEETEIIEEELEEPAPEDSTVFQVIQDTVKENPWIMILLLIALAILIAIGGYSRYRKSRGDRMFK